MQLAKVLHPTGASDRLAFNVGIEGSQDWQDINQLKRFVSAFPLINMLHDQNFLPMLRVGMELRIGRIQN